MRSNSKPSNSKPVNSANKIVSKVTAKVNQQKEKIPIKVAKNQVKNQKIVTNKITTNLTKPVPRVVQRYQKKKDEKNGQVRWSTLTPHYFIKIAHYACKNLAQIYQLSKVCSFWRITMKSQAGPFFWNVYKNGQGIESFDQLQNFLKKDIIQIQQKMSFEYQKHFIKLFNYGSTKQNIPNKLIERLDLQLDIELNGKKFIQPFKIKNYNFSSYLCTKIQQIKDFKYEFYTPHNMFKDSISLKMTFRSRKFKVSHIIMKKYVPEDIVDGAIKQKAFNYFLDKNFVFTYFEGDNHFLYVFFQISLLELVRQFRTMIKVKHQQSLQRKTKKLPMYKQLCQTQFEDFEQYIKFQADFQIHFSYHNSLKQIFTHCDTKVFPIQYNKKQADFFVKVDDSFENISTYKLDNKMGMSENIQDLYLLDFVLKDRDRFIITFSGFIYARLATQKERESLDNYFDYADLSIKVLQSVQPKYRIHFIIIQEGKRNLMKHLKFTIIN